MTKAGYLMGNRTKETKGGLMAKNDALGDADVIDAKTGKVLTLPKRAREKLDTALDVRRANARVYRAMRTGQLDPTDGSKLSFVLMNQLKMIELSEIEQKLVELEAHASLPHHEGS